MRRRQAISIALLCVALLAGPLPARSWLGLAPPSRPQPIELSPLHPTGSVYQGVRLGGALWLPRAMPDGVRLRGLSDLAWSESEQVLYAVSDFGWLFRMQPVFTNGQLTDVRLLDSHPLTDATGRPWRGKWRDSEGLTFAPGPDGNPALFVSFERAPRITRIDTQGRWQADVPLPCAVRRPRKLRQSQRSAGSPDLASAPGPAQRPGITASRRHAGRSHTAVQPGRTAASLSAAQGTPLRSRGAERLGRR